MDITLRLISFIGTCLLVYVVFKDTRKIAKLQKELIMSLNQTRICLQVIEKQDKIIEKLKKEKKNGKKTKSKSVKARG